MCGTLLIFLRLCLLSKANKKLLSCRIACKIKGLNQMHANSNRKVQTLCKVFSFMCMLYYI